MLTCCITVRLYVEIHFYTAGGPAPVAGLCPWYTQWLPSSVLPTAPSLSLGQEPKPCLKPPPTDSESSWKCVKQKLTDFKEQTDDST